MILLVNVTYAPCEWPVRRALELVAREAALPRRGDPPATRACSLRATRWTAWSREWDDAAAARPIHAERRPSHLPARRAPRGALAGLAERHGALERDGDLDAEDALRGSWKLRGERGHVDLAITMAPTVPPLVETLSVESVLPSVRTPGGEARGRDRLRPPGKPSLEASSLGAILAAGSRPRLSPAGDPARGSRPTAPGPPQSPSQATERKATTLRLPGPRGSVDLELELNEPGGTACRSSTNSAQLPKDERRAWTSQISEKEREGQRASG